jgi:hypothetical protein
MPLLVLEDRDSDRVSLFAVDHDIWKVFKPDAPEYFALEVERKLTWACLDCRQASSEFTLKPVREIQTTSGLVVV